MNILAYMPFELLPWQWGALIFGSLCIGMSKTGINGISTIAIPLFVLIFEAKPSTGIILPLLCLADLFAVVYYRRHAEWKYIISLLPWALGGFALALFMDRIVPAKGFKTLMGVCILISLLFMLRNDLQARWLRRRQAAAGDKAAVTDKAPGADTGAAAEAQKPRGQLLRTHGTAVVFGILGGFSTMIGNAAGPIMSVFLLSMKLPKAAFVGTAAWFFLIINYLKIPLQYFAWHNITAKTLLFDLYMAPFIVCGAFLGILLVKKISEGVFRTLVFSLTVISSVLLFL
jgi:uncharacterized membrane protein YfcA